MAARSHRRIAAFQVPAAVRRRDEVVLFLVAVVFVLGHASAARASVITLDAHLLLREVWQPSADGSEMICVGCGLTPTSPPPPEPQPVVISVTFDTANLVMKTLPGGGTELSVSPVTYSVPFPVLVNPWNGQAEHESLAAAGFNLPQDGGFGQSLGVNVWDLFNSGEICAPDQDPCVHRSWLTQLLLGANLQSTLPFPTTLAAFESLVSGRQGDEFFVFTTLAVETLTYRDGTTDTRYVDGSRMYVGSNVPGPPLAALMLLGGVACGLRRARMKARRRS